MRKLEEFIDKAGGSIGVAGGPGGSGHFRAARWVIDECHDLSQQSFRRGVQLVDDDRGIDIAEDPGIFALFIAPRTGERHQHGG